MLMYVARNKNAFILHIFRCCKGFSAGGGTAVNDCFARCRIQHCRAQLRRHILNMEQPVFEAPESGYITETRDFKAVFKLRRSDRNALSFKNINKLFLSCFKRVNPYKYGSSALERLKNTLGFLLAELICKKRSELFRKRVFFRQRHVVSFVFFGFATCGDSP